MEQEYFFPPKKVGDIYPFHHNLYTQLLPVHLTYGFTKEEMDSMKEDDDALAFADGRAKKYNNTGSLYVNTRNVLWAGDPKNPNLNLVSNPAQVAVVVEDDLPKEVAPNIKARVKSMVIRLRNHPKMTKAFARVLGIWPEEKSVENVADYVPVLSGEVVNGFPVLDCAIKGFAGFDIYCDKKGGLELAWESASVGRFWTDRSSLSTGITSQRRSYKVQMLDSDNNPVGLMSNVIWLTAEKVI